MGGVLKNHHSYRNRVAVYPQANWCTEDPLEAEHNEDKQNKAGRGLLLACTPF